MNKKFNQFSPPIMQDQILWNKEFQLSNQESKERSYSSLSSSVNGKFVLASFDDTLEIINSENGMTINKIPTIHKNGIKEICISQYGNYFLTIGGQQKVVLWDGSSLQPIKKFQIAAKSEFIKFVGFNKNETTVYIISEMEIVVFKINSDDPQKQLVKTQLKDRVIEGACLLDQQGALITADNLHFISIYDVNNLVRVNLTQKLSAVNVIRQFEQDSVWMAFSNNTIAVYEIEENEIKFDSFEKKLPFEVLEIQKYNSELYIVGGFDNRLALINKDGHFLKFICQFDNAILIRKFRFNQQKCQLFTISDFNHLTCSKLDLRPEIFMEDNLWVKIVNVSQIELSLLDKQNIGLQDSPDNYTISINGQIKSVAYNQQSYLVILIQTSVCQKIRMIDSQSVLNNIKDLEFSDILEFENPQQQKKSKTLRLKFSQDMQKVYCTAACLIFQSLESLTMTDFDLNVLRTWSFSSKITGLQFLKGLKRKEHLLVALQHGELMKVSLDNTFPVSLLDYKVEIVFFQFNLNKTQLMIIDKNQNLVIFKYQPENMVVTQIFQQSQVLVARFNEKKSDLLFYITKDNKLTLRINNKYQSIQDNFIDLENEQVLMFDKNQILVKKINNIDMRLVTVFVKQLLNDLINDKNHTEAYDMMMKLQIQDQQELLNLALNSFSNLSPISHDIIRETKDLQLIHLSKEIQMKQQEDLKLVKQQIQAEMLCYEGQYKKSVDLLLSSNMIQEAIEMLMVLGKYDQAIKILKNPQYTKNHKNDKYSLNNLIKMQALAAKAKGEINLALDLFQSINQYDEVVKILIDGKKDQDLINLIRGMDSQAQTQTTINTVFNYFKKIKNISYAKECLIKQGNQKGLLDFYIEFEMFEDALNLYGKIQDQQVIDPSTIFLPYAGILLRDNKFEEALEKYKQIGKLDLCVKTLGQFTRINQETKNYLLVSKFIFEKIRLVQGDQKRFPNEALVYLLMKNFIEQKNQISFQKNVQKKIIEKQIDLLILLLNLGNTSLNLLKEIDRLLEFCCEFKQYNKAKFLIEKLIDQDSLEKYSRKWKFLKSSILKKKNQSVDYLYHCYQCNFKGVQTVNDLQCQNCQLNLFFCYLSAQQLPIISIQFSQEFNKQQLHSLNCYRIFSQNEKLQLNQWESKEEIEDPFQQSLQKQYEYQQEKGSYIITNASQLQKMQMLGFNELDDDQYFYKYNQDLYFQICKECKTYYELESFELFHSNENCQICKKNDFNMY